MELSDLWNLRFAAQWKPHKIIAPPSIERWGVMAVDTHPLLSPSDNTEGLKKMMNGLGVNRLEICECGQGLNTYEIDNGHLATFEDEDGELYEDHCEASYHPYIFCPCNDMKQCPYHDDNTSHPVLFLPPKHVLEGLSQNQHSKYPLSQVYADSDSDSGPTTFNALLSSNATPTLPLLGLATRSRRNPRLPWLHVSANDENVTDDMMHRFLKGIRATDTDLGQTAVRIHFMDQGWKHKERCLHGDQTLDDYLAQGSS